MNKILNKKVNNSIKFDCSDFPNLCDSCLGSNNLIKMTKAEFDLECKICVRPFVVFRWKSDYKNFKRTEICRVCSKVKHLCQSCLLDLRFGLPMDERDSLLKQKIEVPKDQTNRDYWSYKMTKNIDKLDLPYNKDKSYSILDKYLLKEKIISNKNNDLKDNNLSNNNNELKLNELKDKNAVNNSSFKENSLHVYKRGLYLNNNFSKIKFDDIKFKK